MRARTNSLRWLSAFFAGACIVSLWVYRGALHGDFISDDSFFVVGLARDYAFDWKLVAKAFDPSGDLQYEVMAYQPAYLVVSRLEWALFGSRTFGYHVVNVIFHALNAALLLAVMRSQGVRPRWALLGSAIFALHPANVEAVAWISQLRAVLALTGALVALSTLQRHPGVATLAFSVGLLCKFSAAFALPVALGLHWCASRDPEQEPPSLRWIGAWIGVLVLCAYPALASTSLRGSPGALGATDLIRNAAADAARYLVMAVTSWGVSAFHSPRPVVSWWNSWFLASLAMGGVLLWRIVHVLVHRRREAAWWLGAGAAFAMVSRIFPFYSPLADRYLYFMLPGFLIAVLLWKQDVERWLAARSARLRERIPRIERGLEIACALLLVVFAFHSSARAALWHHEASLMIDSASHYPEGGVAYYVRAAAALERGDIDAAIPELRGVVRTRYYRLVDLFQIPGLAPFVGDPRIVRIRHHVARLTIRDFAARKVHTQQQMRAAASAHFYLGEYDAAIELLEAALRRGDRRRPAILADLEMIRRARRDHGRDAE